MGTKDLPVPSSGTLKRGPISRQTTDDSGTHHTSGSGGVSHHPLQPPPNPGIIKQSSTDSGHSTSHRSSDVAYNNRQRQQQPGGQSWHGTPRTELTRRGAKTGKQAYSVVGDNQSTTLPRRAGPTGGDLHPKLQQEPGGCNSLDGTLIKRRSAAPAGGSNYGEAANTSIPLIQFHLVNGSPNNSQFSSNAMPFKHRNESDPLDEHGTDEDVFYHQSNRDNTIITHNKGSQKAMRGQQTQKSNKPYIKYNSFANY